MIKKLLLPSLLGTLYMFMACNKANDLGSFLEENNEIGIFFDSLQINCTTVSDNTGTTWNIGETFIPTNPAGQIRDPLFGLAQANLNFQIGIRDEPDFTDAMLDSVVLTLAFDTTRRSYGPFNEPVGFEVYKLIENLHRDSSYFTSSTFETDPTMLGMVDGLEPDFQDTIIVVEPRLNRLDTISYLPHLRIKLDADGGAYGQELLNLDVSDFASNEIFRQKIKGLVVRPTQQCGQMLYFNMFDGLTRLNLYYTQRDTARLLTMPVLNTNVAANTYNHDFSGSKVGQVLDDEAENDSILFVQSMGGPSVKIELADLQPLENSVINNAQLVFNLAYLAEDDTATFIPIQQCILENADREVVDDIGQLLYSNDLDDFFGGDLVLNQDGTTSYIFNVTKQVQSMVQGNQDPVMYLTNQFKGALANRTVLYGTTHPSLGAKLYITFTEF